MKHPSLQIRLLHDLGKLPAGISIVFPADIAHSLIRRRLATPVGSLDSFADLVIGEDQLQDCGIDLWTAAAQTETHSDCAILAA